MLAEAAARSWRPGRKAKHRGVRSANRVGMLFLGGIAHVESMDRSRYAVGSLHGRERGTAEQGRVETDGLRGNRNEHSRAASPSKEGMPPAEAAATTPPSKNNRRAPLPDVFGACLSVPAKGTGTKGRGPKVKAGEELRGVGPLTDLQQGRREHAIR